jgi:hypothetical protein
LEKFDNINQLTAHFENAVKDCLKQTYSDWIKNHYSKLWHLQSILDELKVYLPANGKGHNLPEELWDEVKKKFNQIIAWSNNIKYTSDDLSLKSLSNTWQKGFNEIQYGLPEKVKLDVSPSLFQIQSADKNGIKFRKKIYSFIKKLSLNIIGSKTTVRKVDLHNFLINFLEVPITNVVFNLWQQFLTEISDQYNDIFKKISELKEKSLFVDDLENLQDPFEKNDYFEKIFKIAEVLNQTDIILQSLHERENQMDHLIGNEWKKTIENIEYYWQYAGTFVLPNKKYREELLSYNKKVAEKNFKKYVNYWKEYFFGIKSNWVKNLEVFNFQLHVIEEFRGSSKNIMINTEVILNPAFEDVLSLIDKEENRYTAKSSSSIFKQKVFKTKEVFLVDFKNQKIPQLVDAIYQTQIPETLENYIYQIEYANNKISASHNIVKFQKNGTLPLKPKIYSIAFPELINNEILQPYRKYYINQVLEVKNRISSIVRSLTEINHLYELNWDSAATLIKNSNGNGEYEEALSIIKTSFKRSREIIEKLQQESKESLAFSNDLLIKKSQELYSGYQRLINTDQLIDYNSKLKREKNQIHIQGVIKKFYDFTIHTFSVSAKYIFNKTTSIFIKDKDRNSTSITEILTNYSKQAKLKLLNIPTVYQRLFLLEPESDDRFYFERKNETEKISKNFQRWQKNNDVLSVLVGEKGAGKTSLLNFVEKNVFKDQNVLRINIELKNPTEHELLSILKNSFKFKNINSWENLENKIIKIVRSQIVIIDNLHHLFLKIPNGFDTLERFLLFLQQTQHNVFWLLSCSYFSWMMLDKILDISKHINSIIYLDPLSSVQLKDIIFERHKISGYEILYETDEDEKKGKKLKKLHLENRLQKYLEDKFFDKLSRISGGNLTAAFQYWLSSIKEFKDNNILLNPISSIDSNRFEQLNASDLFTLVPFIQHDNLNIDESVAIMRQLSHQNMLTFNRLVSYGLLEKRDKYYTLNMLYYPAIKEILISKKYVHNLNQNGKGNQIQINLYLPVKTNTLIARKIAFQSAAISKYIDLSKEISVNILNKIYDGVSILNLQIHANVSDPKYTDVCISEVTEMIFNELLQQKVISQDDFYN